MFDLRVGLGDGFSDGASIITSLSKVATSFITSDAAVSVAKTKAKTDQMLAASQNQLVLLETQLQTESDATLEASITKWVLYGAGALTLLGVLALVLRRH